MSEITLLKYQTLVENALKPLLARIDLLLETHEIEGFKSVLLDRIEAIEPDKIDKETMRKSLANNTFRKIIELMEARKLENGIGTKIKIGGKHERERKTEFY